MKSIYNSEICPTPAPIPAANQRPIVAPSTNKAEDNNIVQQSILKRHSTITSIHEEPIHTQSTTPPMSRHYSTGYTLKSVRQLLEDKERVDLMKRSEEFQKELNTRRKAFKRLSRLLTDDNDDKVLMGTRISEGHRNYVLMYNMLTGIRIAVSRVTAKIDRALTDEDFDAAHKLAFDVIGDELTPGAKYDFKFKDYAPWVFRHLREKFGISLTSKYILSELGSPGKSGSFFYYSRDYRFIIKTIHYTEHKFMRKILKEYYKHICDNPGTLLCRYYGLHRIKLPHGKKIHFVVMSNVFPPNKDIHETYDLKGSTLGRFLPEEEIRKNPYAVMKDLNWEKRQRKLQLGPLKRKLFISQLVRDVTLLSQLNIMDYSLLVGVHDMLRGNKDNIRDSTLQTFQPNTKSIQRRITQMRRRTSKAQVVREAIAGTNPHKLDVSQLPEETQERRRCIFYTDEGGFQATDENNRPLPVLYSLGIIDILTPYDLKKKSEHVYKSVTTKDKHGISAVKPTQYGQRFLEFMARAVLEHNDDIPHEFKLKSKAKHLFFTR
ncbi:Putative 1-phosphatidylinositol-4-phosphate 5-kinase [Rhizopus microsporus]|nr:Putative 1-phosphatidylinositol-4-phosphate 5-kinase [Rhizopus microsporus]